MIQMSTIIDDFESAIFERLSIVNIFIRPTTWNRLNVPALLRSSGRLKIQHLWKVWDQLL